MGYMSDDWPSAPPRNVSLTYVSLFSGIGGFDLGFDRAGMTCLAQVEWDKKARAVLDYHWRDTQHFKDVRDVGKHNLPNVDLVTGGFPCQDVSIAAARTRKGLAGNRSGLWFEFKRLLDELHPQWVVIENTPGLLSSHRGRDFAIVLRGLVECGYSVCWRVLDAQYWGVAQQRQRVFIVGSLRSGRAASVLFESDPKLFQAPEREMVSPTLIANGQLDNGGGTWAHGLAIWTGKHYRRLTPIECERLQGFPDHWTDVNEHNDNARWKQLGNAVAVPVAQWIGERIMKAVAS